MTDETCKHLQSFIRVSDPIFTIYCPNCNDVLPAHVVVNSFLDAMRTALQTESK